MLEQASASVKHEMGVIFLYIGEYVFDFPEAIDDSVFSLAASGIYPVFNPHTVFTPLFILAGAGITSTMKCEEGKIDFTESGLSSFSLVSQKQLIVIGIGCFPENSLEKLHSQEDFGSDDVCFRHPMEKS